MNDRYLYRAKRTDNGEWVEGCLIKDEQDDVFFIGYTLGIDICNDAHDIDICLVHQETICQCTGKTDIEKNLIFEHDAVSFLDATSTEYGYAEHWQVGEVLWDDETASFQVTERLSAESYEVLEDCKVLGNTIDNPELLEVRE